jgi:hypothetical protein
VILSVYLNLNCSHKENRLEIDPKFYLGSTQAHGITRGSEVITTGNESFNDFICMRQDDLKKILEKLIELKQNQCEAK